MNKHNCSRAARGCDVLWIMSCSTLSFCNLVEVDLGLICPKNVLPVLCWLFLFKFFIKPFYFWGLWVACTLQWTLRTFLRTSLHVSLRYKPTPWRVLFTRLAVVKGFFFTMETILRSSTTLIFCGHPGVFCVAQFTRFFVSLFLFRMCQTVDFASPDVVLFFFLIDFLNIFTTLMMTCFTCMESCTLCPCLLYYYNWNIFQ